MNEIFTIFLIFGLTFILILISGITLGSIYAIPSENVAIIKIHGSITLGDSLIDSSLSSDSLISSLKEAENNPNVKAIVLSINSPGGTVVSSKEVAEYIKNMKKPVISWIREISTSGAYLIASSSDYLVADELSVVGSIGAKISYLEYSETLKKYGVEYVSITSGEMKDMASSFVNISSQDREILESQVNASFNYFLNSVVENRNLTDIQVNQIKDGRVFSGVQALKLNLIDECGGIKQVEEYLSSLNITNITYKEYNSAGLMNEILSLKDFNSNLIFPKYD